MCEQEINLFMPEQSTRTTLLSLLARQTSDVHEHLNNLTANWSAPSADSMMQRGTVTKCIGFVRMLSARANQFRREAAFEAGGKAANENHTLEEYAVLKRYLGSENVQRRDHSGLAACANQRARMPGQHGVPLEPRRRVRFPDELSTQGPALGRHRRYVEHENEEEDTESPPTKRTIIFTNPATPRRTTHATPQTPQRRNRQPDHT